MQWMMGPVRSVMAKTATMARRIEAEDTGAAIFNCLASLHFRRLFPLLRSCRTWLSRFSI
jgi:hypothetical protein